MTEIRYIDTAGLPSGFDVADLIEQGVVGSALVAWCKARVKPGLPPPPAPQAKKTRPVAGELGPGQGATEPGRESPRSKPTAPDPAPSTNVVATRKPAPQQDLDLPPEYSDDALADTFSGRYGNSLAYVHAWGRWLIWDQTRWQTDETLRARDMARTVARSVAAAAATRVDLGPRAARIANALSSARTIGAIEQLARADRRHAATQHQWDQDPWALNTPGGIVDLQAGTLRPSRKEDYATKITRAAPGGECPQWLEFLRVVTDGDDELVAFMRRMAGYCLTGITREHALFFVYGGGGNGKGTFLNTIDWMLNDYARAANMDMFVEQKYQSHPTDVAGLMGARLVTAQETEEGKRWHESRLKAFTGGDPITARFMRQDEFTFIPQFKLVFAGNHKPLLRNVDEAIRRRLYLIPFTVTIDASRRDPYLYAKLRDEMPGILQWCIDGCLDWQDNMLAPPDRVLATTEDYFEDQDTLKQFFADCCEFDRNYRVVTTDLYRRYGRWAEEAGEFVLPRRRWLQQLANHGIQSNKVGGTKVIEGMRIIQQEPASRSDWD